VQEEACKTHPFPCIKAFSFVGFRVTHFPIYKHIHKLRCERPDAIYLDVGCCVGNDMRKVVKDGFPAENVVATDIMQDFWDLGHKLYKSTPESYPVKFIAGDIFDSAHLELTEVKSSMMSSPPPSLQSLTSLNPLRGHVSVICASSFFHLFDENKQLDLARRLAGLLDPRPGSTIFGSHVGLRKKGIGKGVIFNDKWEMFCHSPESWNEMWEDQVFGKGVVRVDAQLHDVDESLREAAVESSLFHFIWSVVRL